MRANDREDDLYSKGKRVRIDKEEKYMLSLVESCSNKNRTLLDIGCGTGEISLALNKLGFETFGLDFSSVAIDIAKKNGVKCQQADLDLGIPADDASFDIAWAGDVIEHVFDPIGVLSEISRILVPGGSFLATIPHDLNYKVRIKTLLGISYQEAVYRKFRQFKHHTFFSENLLRYMYESSNLKIQQITYLIKIPIFKLEFFTKIRLLRIFATLMIVKSIKN